MNDQEPPRTRRTTAESVLAPGTALSNRYEIVDYIGAGGMGQVYKAHDRVLDEIVAIKVLLPHLLGSPLMSRRFRSEIKLARRVTHRNVCRIHDYGEDGPLAYISMQFVEGAELTALIARTDGVSVREAYAIAIQLADGLQAIHEAGIVHRDFKSANVMVDRRGDPRVMDFGIAKVWNAEPGLTTDGQIAGTPAYMSPEQGAGEALDPRADLYSMGVVLFELFTGTRPFAADNAAAMMYKHAYEAPPLDDPIGMAIPAPVKPIIGKALAKQRDDRFSSAEELKRALLDVRASLPALGPDTTESIAIKVRQLCGTQDETVRARTPSPVTSASAPPRPARSNRWLVALVASAAIVSGMLVAANWVASRAPERELTGSRLARAPGDAPKVPATTTAGDAVTSSTANGARQSSPVPVPPAAVAPAASPAAAVGATDAASAASAACGRGEPRGCGDACEAGDAAACTQLGVLYNRGAGVARDLTAASLYYDRGCAGGDLAGCNNLGTIYQHGAVGLRGDRSKAASLYERACSGGHHEGCANLGLLYLGDPGASTQQRTRGRTLLQQACAAGVERACRARTMP